jgi:hypothetical protein
MVAALSTGPLTLADLKARVDGTWFMGANVEFCQLNVATFEFFITESSLREMTFFQCVDALWSIKSAPPLATWNMVIFDDSQLPFLRAVLAATTGMLAIRDCVALANIATALSNRRFRSILGDGPSVTDDTMPRIRCILDVGNFEIADDVVRRGAPDEDMVDRDLRILKQADPWFGGLTRNELFRVLDCQESGRLNTLVGDERVFCYNTRIGVRPRLRFRAQTPFEPTERPFLYEVVLSHLSKLAEPVSMSDLLAKLKGKQFQDDGETVKISKEHYSMIEKFVRTSPIIFSENSRYFLMPLESEVDFYGNLYFSEIYHMFSVYRKSASTCFQLAETLEFLRFPVGNDQACFVGRIDKFIDVLPDRLRLPSDVALEPSLMEFFVTGSHQIVRLAPLRTIVSREVIVDRSIRKGIGAQFPKKSMHPLGSVLPLAVTFLDMETFTVTDFIGALQGFRVTTYDGLEFTVGVDDFSFFLVERELRFLSTFRPISLGIFTFKGVRPPADPDAAGVFENLGDLVYHALEVLHTKTKQIGAAFTLDEVNKEMAGYRYAEGHSRRKVVEVWKQSSSLAGQVLSLEREGLSVVVSMDRSRMGLIKFSPDSTGFKMKTYSARKAWSPEAQRRYVSECSDRHSPTDLDSEFVARKIERFKKVSLPVEELPPPVKKPPPSRKPEQLPPKTPEVVVALGEDRWDEPLMTRMDYHPAMPEVRKEICARNPPPPAWKPDLEKVAPEQRLRTVIGDMDFHHLSLDETARRLHSTFAQGLSIEQFTLEIARILGEIRRLPSGM